MKNRIAIIASMIFAVIGSICLSAPEIANAKTKTTSSTTLLAQNQCRINQFENRVFQLTNSIRHSNGLRPLKWNCRLIMAAKNHSQDMAKINRMSHSGSDGSTIAMRAERVGYRYSYLAENVAAGQRSPEQVVDDWMKSPGHRRNILNPNITEIGVGFYNQYWTQVFGSK